MPPFRPLLHCHWVDGTPLLDAEGNPVGDLTGWWTHSEQFSALEDKGSCAGAGMGARSPNRKEVYTMKRRIETLLCVLALLATGVVAAHAQQQQKPAAGGDEQATPKQLPYVVRVRLPNYFGQIGLTREQRTELRKVCERFDRKIAEIRWRIAQLQAELIRLRNEKEKACEEMLDDVQKQRLDQLRKRAAQRRRSRRDQPADGAAQPQ